MNMQNIEEKVCNLIDEVMINACWKKEKAKPEHDFIDDLRADSLDQVELIMKAEDEFDIEISDEDAKKVRTVQQAIDLIRTLI